MKSVTYKVPNIHCGHCVMTIKMEVGEIAGVQSVEAGVDEQRVVVSYDEPATEQQIVATLTEINYPPLN